MKTQNREIGVNLLGFIADYFKILSEPLRLKILNSLRDGEKTVSEIVRDVGSPQPNVSKHLSMLVQAGFVIRRQRKNVVYCSIADKHIWKICDLACPRSE